MTDADRLLREIVANPAADVLRLAFADAIEERDGPGDEAWAVFVRAQVWASQCEVCHGERTFRYGDYFCSNCQPHYDRERELWPAVRPVFAADGVNLWRGQWPGGNTATPAALVSRGFVSHVRCTLAEWRGGECKACWGQGWRANHASNHPIIDSLKCPDCHGTGRTTGIGPRLAQAWPVVEVRTEKVPQAYPAEKPDEYGWCHRRPNEPFNIPQEIWELLEGGTRDGQHDAWIDYPTEPAARAALSAALIRWARSQAI